ncbi:MAG: hypothetical protein J1F63_07155 [Oscillospiraceae bacterium]|nr:hypothetical protein [Oscillospiraceae bacterium]
MQPEDMENELQEEEGAFDLLEIFELIRGKIIWIVAFAMLGAVLAYGYSSFLITPKYSAKAVLYVNNEKTISSQSQITTTALSATARLVPTYQAIIRTKTAMRRVINEQGIEGYSPEQLLSMVSTKASDEETGVFEIWVTGEDQYYVAEIANAVAAVSTSEISKYVEGTTASIFDSARIPISKSYPSNRRNAIVGGIIGAALYVVFIVLRGLMDLRIKRAEDFSRVMNAPVIGVIPNMAIHNEGHGYALRKNGATGEN